ncbi:MAG: hypothetical protein QOG68_2751 [Solirubrobacteraceae bacterium]|jgi:uncharacterized protein (TIGR02118 family)|nr:hypothetical protein [Solirubrobacteraceae bacterium]
MARYLSGHEPLCRELPGLRRIELSSPFDTLSVADRRGDRRGPPFLVSELYFDDRAAFDRAMTSPAGRAVMADLEVFAKDEVSMYIADVERDHAPS